MKDTTIDDISLISIPKIKEVRGNLGVIEGDVIPFEIKRVYYLYDVPSDAQRGGHAHKELYQFLIPLSGSFDIKLHDGINKKTIHLNKPDKGLLLVPGIWREMDNFSSGAVCLVLASQKFNEADYIRDFKTFKSFKR
ncbi:FdtA/QdtA family cupin domain-containing protein [Gangjinia marincola]|uniref:FdtA/QdtA family cupin domain-containing protein n=1 Tax=Gangjinia marincola TaxID=578463 RepID=A0ABN1MDL7_9FLAO